MNKNRETKLSKTITLKTLNKIRRYIGKRNIAFSLSHISKNCNIHHYYTKAAIQELLKNKEIIKIPSSSKGSLFINNIPKNVPKP